jgi:septal ring factor EnvC (AmiA/AmiB activator)
MPKSPGEPTNLVLEQLRLMRAETNARFDKLEAEIAEVKTEISEIKKDLRGFKLNTIAEVYKANLSVASFADHERRIQALERHGS